MQIIALTGGIASGKSTVANIFSKKYNIPIIDSDVIAREVIKDRDILSKIIQKFGKNIVKNEQLDRQQLRSLVFNNQSNKQWLEDLLHPLINQEIRTQIKKIAITRKYEYCLAMIPLITKEYLANNDYISKVIVVDCPKDLQLKRASVRDKQDVSQIQKIIDAQLSRNERNKLADYIISNNGNIIALEQQIKLVHEQLCTGHFQ